MSALDRPRCCQTSDVCTLFATKSNYEQVDILYRRALQVLEKVYGPDHQKVTSALNNWASLLAQQVINFP